MNQHPKENSHLSLEERAYREIRGMIMQGDLAPGKQIVQETLAEQLGLSRTPLRKAIATLAEQNFIEMDARGVAYVRSFNGEELTSIWEIRAVLEGLVCRMAAKRIQPQHVAYLRSLITTAAEEISPEDWSAYRKADVHFHSYLVEVADDPLLRKILDSFQILTLTLSRGLLRPPEETLPEHLEIAGALQAGDPDLAEQTMVRHVRSSIPHVRTFEIDAEARLKEIAIEHLASLSEEVRETSFIAVQQEEGVGILQHHEVQRTLRVAIDPASRLPLHATAAGKTLLAWKNEDEPALNDIRSRGFAVEDGEYEPGVKSIAAPVWHKERMIAALSVIAPGSRLDTNTTLAVASRVVQYARAISSEL